MEKEHQGNMVFDNQKFKIYNEDILSTQTIEDCSIDLIITSPPYNLDIKYGSNNDKLPYSRYLEFSEKY